MASDNTLGGFHDGFQYNKEWDEQLAALGHGISHGLKGSIAKANEAPKRRNPQDFDIVVVENGYTITYNDELYVYKDIDDIIDNFIEKFAPKPKELS